MDIHRVTEQKKAARVLRSARFGAPRATASERVPGSVVIGCPRPGCPFTASARTEGRAVSAICGHLVTVHIQPPTGSAA